MYDGQGERVAQQVSQGASITTTVYVGDVEEVSTTGSTTITTTYYSANGKRIALGVNGQISYLASDALGSATLAFGSSGTATASQLFAPYGGVRYSTCGVNRPASVRIGARGVHLFVHSDGMGIAATKADRCLIATTSPSLPLTLGQATLRRLIGSLGASTLLARAASRPLCLPSPPDRRPHPPRPPYADRDLELLVLRQELLVLRRTAPPPRWRTADRMILAALGRRLSVGALLLVQLATVLGWHRALVHRRWAVFGLRRGPGRPKLSAECRELVLQLARENPLWGYERIRGELLQLGHRVSSTSIRNLLRRHRISPAPRRAGLTWRRFLEAHGRTILACDYFTVGTVFLKRLYVLVFLELASRRILFTACSEHPGGVWAAQQARNLAWQLQEAEIRPRFLIHDRDSNFPAAFDAVFRSEGLEVIRTPVRAPNANARCERWVSSVRRECLDWLLIVGRRHLETLLAEYVEHYNGHRPHRSLELQPPRGPTVQPAVAGGQVVRQTRVHGLINEYSRQAA